MADDNIRRRREIEKRQQEAREWANEGEKSESTSESYGDTYLKKLIELMDRAEPLINQVNSSYNQFMSGALTKPPNESRLLLDQIMTSLQLMAKPTQAYRFRYNGIAATYLTYKNRWEKLLKDLEDGKVVRRVLPGSRKAG